MLSLGGKVAIVTGASRGIGKAIAQAFAREGAHVAICGRKQETLEAVVQESGTLTGKLLPVVCHVGRPADIQRLVDTTLEQFGRIDILVNNAGTNVAQEPVLQVDEAKFDKMIEINLKSAFRLMQAAAPGMCARGSGSIINISSISGLRPQYQGMLYSMTKAALIMMTKSYAQELGPSGVRVNAIAPGLIRTALSEYYWKDEAKLSQILARQPIRHLGEPEEVAEMAMLLASDRASYITGQVLVIDGGRMSPVDLL
ncbi:MAG TPA: SDR family oxidoreductase [Bryobacteraceae bacterium]|jgi:NAD(P)-dependent dehydrogenase (short-subunit alcohol dehydrogenase family)